VRLGHNSYSTMRAEAVLRELLWANAGVGNVRPAAGSDLPSQIFRPAAPIQIVVTV